MSLHRYHTLSTFVEYILYAYMANLHLPQWKAEINHCPRGMFVLKMESQYVIMCFFLVLEAKDAEKERT